MSGKWTGEQKEVIYNGSGNLLVSAAAGSGKTAVLVEKVIESIACGKSDISSIVLFTFTNASAAELKQRISEGLRKRFRNSQDSVFDEQIKLLPMSSIGTIHSFCSNLLRNNFTKTSLPKNFKIGEEAELSMLFKKAFDKTMDEQYESADEDFFDMAEAFCGRDREDFESLIKTILNYSKALPEPSAWLHSCAERLTLCPDSESGGVNSFGAWGRELIKHSRLKAEGIKLMYDEIICASSALSEKYYAFFEAESQLAERIISALDEINWDIIYNEIQSISFKSMPRKSKDTDEALLNFIKTSRECIKKEIKYLKEKIFYADSQKAASHIRSMQGHIKSLVDTVCKTESNYIKLKNSKNLVDFNDLEQLSIKLLENGNVSLDFTDIYIDEYQDTNAAQNRLLELLSSGADLFAVGDVKQSIYGFRNARPENFLEREVLYSKVDSGGKVLYLSNNFRSHGNIISFINCIFSNIMSPYVGDVSYDEAHRLRNGLELDTESKVEINVIEKKLGDNEADSIVACSGEYVKNDAALREAQFTARRIYDLVEVEKPMVFDKDTNISRPISYGDIAVLMRKTKGSAKLISGCLTELGIPVLCEENTGYFASHEVKLLLSVLEVIDNPYRDIPLLTVMRSPAFSFTDNQLAEIRLECPEGSFYEAVLNSDDNKCIRLKNELQLFRDKYETMSLYELLRFILDRTGYEKFASVLANPAARRANILLLCDKAAEFEKNGRRSLFEFIQYIKNMINNNFDFSVSNSGSYSSCVKIMSIHKSKGLEFPAVFLVNTAAQFNFTDLRRNVMYDSELGIASDCIVKSRMIKYTNLAKQAMIVKKKAEILSEEMRILYVALTRAKYYLFISGSVSDTDKFKEKFENFRGDSKSGLFYRVSTYSDFLSWIMCGLSGASADINYIMPSSISGQSRSETQHGIKKIDFGNVTPDPRLQSEFSKKFNFVYNIKTPQPSKMSISDIRSLEDESGEFRFKSPLFYSKDSSHTDDVLYKKTIHFIVQNLDLNFVSSGEDIYRQICKMASLGMIPVFYTEKIKKENIYKIDRFFRSDTGRAFLASEFYGREYRFFTYLGSRDLFGDSGNSNGETLVQGVIDCFFEHKGKIVIVNYINKNRSEKIYEKALSKVLGKEVSKTVTVNIY